MNFYLTMVYGSLAIMALFMSGYWGIFTKQIIPCMAFAVMGLILLILGYHTNPFKEEN